MQNFRVIWTFKLSENSWIEYFEEIKKAEEWFEIFKKFSKKIVIQKLGENLKWYDVK